MTDERPDSLAAQAAAWVPPWERAQRPPDAGYAAAHGSAASFGEDDDEELAEAGLSDDDDFAEAALPGDGNRSAAGESGGEGLTEGAESGDEGLAEGAEPGDGEFAEADVSDDTGIVEAGAAEDDRGPVIEGPDPAEGESGVPGELPPLPGEVGGPAGVDSPQVLPGASEPEPTDVGGGPESPLPEAVAEAVEHEIDSAPMVDAPLPADGDDAGDVVDAAADDDVAEDGEADLRVSEIVPDPDADDEDQARAADDADAPSTGDDTELSADDAAAAGAADVAAAVAGGVFAGGAGAGGASDGADEPVARARPRSGIPAQGRRSKGDGAASAAASPRTEKEEEDAAPPAVIDDGELRAALEAILLVVDEPVAEMQLAQIMEQPTERVAAMLEDISARYTAAGHGFDLRRAAGGWRLYTRPEYAAYVERFVLDGQSVRLTQAALETLAVVAYKQPVTRSRISAIRGVNCDGVMRTLNTRGLIEECGTESETGAFLYRTTALFLEKLGLNSVDQLPPLAPFLPDDVEEVLDASG